MLKYGPFVFRPNPQIRNPYVTNCDILQSAILIRNCLSHGWLTFLKRCYWFFWERIQQERDDEKPYFCINQKRTQIMTYIVILMSFQTMYLLTVYSFASCSIQISHFVSVDLGTLSYRYTYSGSTYRYTYSDIHTQVIRTK